MARVSVERGASDSPVERECFLGVESARVAFVSSPFAYSIGEVLSIFFLNYRFFTCVSELG